MTISIDVLWQRILGNEGSIFHTKTGKEFVYEVSGEVLTTNRTTYNLSKSQFAKPRTRADFWSG